MNRITYRGNEYPSNWPEIARAIKNRAGWHCEWCNNAHGERHHISGSKVVLTVHHLGAPDMLTNEPGNCHNKFDNRPENLVALCQRCHLWADHESHMRRAAETRRRKKIVAGQFKLKTAV